MIIDPGQLDVDLSRLTEEKSMIATDTTMDNLSQHTIDDEFTSNLFMTSTKQNHKFTNSPIQEFKVLHKGQRAFYNPFLMVYFFQIFFTLKTF